MAETRAQGRIDSMGVLETPELYNYILETTVYPRESEFLKEIRDITATLPRHLMSTSPDSGQMIVMLLELIGAKKTIEVGVFTGYSLLLTALTIPPDGKITAIDVNRNTYKMGLPIIQKAKVDHKINFTESEALPVLNQLLNEENEGSFDFAYVDADKANYWNYHERLMKLVKVGGVVVYDDTLWQGTVAISEEETPERHKITRRDMVEFNKLISADPRVRIVHVPMGDGMTVCRRVL